MTAAYRLKSLGWCAGCAALVLGFYLVSLQVAAERKTLEDVNAKIDAAQRDVRALETEFDTRANLVQLEKWNGDTLALAAPTARQFVRDEAALAAIDVHAAAGQPVETAQLVVPSLPSATSLTGAIPVVAGEPAAPARIATARASAPVPATAVAVAPPQMPGVVRAAAVDFATSTGRHPDRAMPAAPHRRSEAVAMLDRKLLSDHTFASIISGARAESDGSR